MITLLLAIFVFFGTLGLIYLSSKQPKIFDAVVIIFFSVVGITLLKTILDILIY